MSACSGTASAFWGELGGSS